MPTTTVRAGARLLVIGLIASLGLMGPGAATYAAPADKARSSLSAVADSGAPVTSEKTKLTKKQKAKKRRLALKKRVKKFTSRVVRAARSRLGRPYQYGAAGPNAFDCSGLTQWVYRQSGKYLPRTSGAQAGATMRVRSPRVGDLVFFHNGGHVYHVGIYAGGHQLWHASRPGVPVTKARIWTGSIFYGRVRGI